MRNFDYLEKILDDQNSGIPCPYCHSPQGHRATCRTLNGTIDTPKFQPLSTQARALLLSEPRTLTKELVDILVLSTEDRLRLRSLGVKW
jgi:hypothetical protein